MVFFYLKNYIMVKTVYESDIVNDNRLSMFKVLHDYGIIAIEISGKGCKESVYLDRETAIQLAFEIIEITGNLAND